MDEEGSPSATSESCSAHLNSSRKRRHSECSNSKTREYGVMRDTGRNDTARFVGSGSGIHFIRSVYLRLVRQSSLRSRQPSPIDDLVPGEDDQLQARQSTSRDGVDAGLWRVHEVSSLEGGMDYPNPSFQQLVEWSKSYFEAWHPCLPFLNAPSVLAHFEEISSSGMSSLSHLEVSIVKSILSISLADGRQGTPLSQPIPSSLIFQSVEEAMSASQFALSQPASLQATQTALAIQLFLLSMLRLNSASRLGGLIVRMAHHLGLHRCPSRYSFFSKDEANMRRRVFWCIYINERFLCQALGLPLDIRDDDLDVCYPGDERHGTPNADTDSRLLMLTYLAKHARIRGLILELRNKSILNRDDTARRSSYVQAELTKWSNEIHDTVEDETSTEENDEDATQPTLSPGHRLYLVLLKYESMISLNRPMMTSGPSSPEYSAGLQNCVLAAKSIMIALRRYLVQHKLPGEPMGTRLSHPMLQPSFTWAVWISAFILVYASSERQLPLASTLKHLDSGKQALRHVALRDISWPEYCLTAVDELTAAFQELSNATNSPARGQGGHQRHGSRPQDDNSARTRDVAEIPASASGAYAGPSNTSSFPPSDLIPVSTTEGISLPQNTNARYLGPEANSRWINQPSPAPLSMDTQTSWLGFAPESFPSTEVAAGEGQESLVWYDQLFANSFGAIDAPFLAASQSNGPPMDPSWSYLR